MNNLRYRDFGIAYYSFYDKARLSTKDFPTGPSRASGSHCGPTTKQ